MKSPIKIFLIIAILLPAISFGQTSHIDGLFAEGNNLFKKEQYNNALDKYIEILDSGYENEELYFNLGNTYYKIGERGKAVLFYEKAKLFNSDDDDLKTNLELVNIELADRITPIPDVFYVAYWNKTRKFLPLSWWKNIFLFSWWLAFLSLSVYLLNKQFGIRKLMKVNLIIAGFSIVICSSVFLSDRYIDRNNKSAVVMHKEVKVLASPSETGTEVFIIHEGTKVKIKRDNGDWVEVSLADGKVGWIRENTIEII